jgi:signal transduction histidine kinase
VLSLAGSPDDDPEEPFDPVTVTGRVVSDLAELGIAARFSTTEATGAWLVLGRPAQLESMITSVISNAVDHGAAAGNITVRLAAVDSHVEITLENSKSIQSTHAGLGLGTYIVGELAKLLAASVEYWESDDCFWTTIRLRCSAAVPAPLHQVSALLLA